MKNKTLSDLFAHLREKRPLVHHITNYVTVNDCANITISVGAAPVMADAPEEVCEMVSFADALVLNIGTLNKGQIESMVLAGGMANDRGVPIILDPVGAGATHYRTESAQRLLDELKITILKGNAGEIGILAGAEASVRGVDSHGCNRRYGNDSRTFRKTGRHYGCRKRAGRHCDRWQTPFSCGKWPSDDGKHLGYRLHGSICDAAFAAVADDPVIASAAALAAFGIAGEKAAAGARGPYSFRTALFDEMAAMKPEDLASRCKDNRAMILSS